MVGTLMAGAARLARALAALALAGASAAMFGQVVARFAFSAPFAWAEELAVLLFAWITFLGAAAVQADDSHLSIDMLRTALPARGRRWLDRVRLAVIGVCAVVLVVQGVSLSTRMSMILYPAMEISRAWLYASVPVGFAFVLAFALRALADPPAKDGDGADAHSIE